jgi:hypothetical protein
VINLEKYLKIYRFLIKVIFGQNKINSRKQLQLRHLVQLLKIKIGSRQNLKNLKNNRIKRLSAFSYSFPSLVSIQPELGKITTEVI